MGVEHRATRRSCRATSDHRRDSRASVPRSPCTPEARLCHPAAVSAPPVAAPAVAVRAGRNKYGHLGLAALVYLRLAAKYPDALKRCASPPPPGRAAAGSVPTGRPS